MPDAPKKQRGDATRRALRAAELRVRGHTWQECADAVGLSDGANAARLVRQKLGSVPQIERDEARALWRDRLELLWRQALDDVEDQRPGAVRAAVALAQRAAQLDGLDQPSRHEVRSITARLDVYPGGSLEAHLSAGGEPLPEHLAYLTADEVAALPGIDDEDEDR